MTPLKSERSNVSDRELQALKRLVKELLNYPAPALSDAIRVGELVELNVNDDG